MFVIYVWYHSEYVIITMTRRNFTEANCKIIVTETNFYKVSHIKTPLIYPIHNFYNTFRKPTILNNFPYW
jgi:hypothetical protein